VGRRGPRRLERQLIPNGVDPATLRSKREESCSDHAIFLSKLIALAPPAFERSDD
jgi:hypothetical protein